MRCVGCIQKTIILNYKKSVNILFKNSMIIMKTAFRDAFYAVTFFNPPGNHKISPDQQPRLLSSNTYSVSITNEVLAIHQVNCTVQ